MSDKAQRRRQKKLAKQKKKRAEASQRRTKQLARRAPAKLDATTTWPVGECYVSENWHEPAVTVQAVFTRRSTDGAMAGAAFEIDLAERGVTKARPLTGLNEGILQAELVRRADEHAMVTQDGNLIVKLVEEGEALSRRNGHKLPKGLEAARAIFGDVSADDCPHDIHTGTAPPPDPPRKPGIITRALDKLFGG